MENCRGRITSTPSRAGNALTADECFVSRSTIQDLSRRGFRMRARAGFSLIFDVLKSRGWGWFSVDDRKRENTFKSSTSGLRWTTLERNFERAMGIEPTR